MPHVTYFWDEIEDNVVEEYDGDTGTTIASYTTEPTRYGSVLSQDRSGERRYFQFDGQGNTAELTDSDSIVTDTRCYSGFGTLSRVVGTTTSPYTFRGAYGYSNGSELGFLVVRYRNYTPIQGRWLAPDPAMDGALYLYCGNRPLYLADPSGLRPIHPSPPVDPKLDEWMNATDASFRQLLEWTRIVMASAYKPCYAFGVSEVQFGDFIPNAPGKKCPSDLNLLGSALVRNIRNFYEMFQVINDPCPLQCPCTPEVYIGIRPTITLDIERDIWWKNKLVLGKPSVTLLRFQDTPTFIGPCTVKAKISMSFFFGGWLGACLPGDPPPPPPPP